MIALDDGDARKAFGGRYRSLPPDGHLVVPLWSGRAAKAGLSMYTACKWSSRFAQRFMWHAVELVGPRILIGRTHAWRPPVCSEVWEALVARWSDEVGPFDDAVLHLRRPAYRAGAAILLLRRGVPIAFVKLRANSIEGLEIERRALDALSASGARLLAPKVMGSGSVGEWHYLVLSALPVRIHSVAPVPPSQTFVASYARALRCAFSPPPDTPEDWQPMHGDLTPWNLRSFDGEELVLFDWEGVDWAPPGADLFWYDAVIEVKGLRVPLTGVEHGRDVRAYWRQRLAMLVHEGERDMSATILERLSHEGGRTIGCRVHSSRGH